MFKILIDRLRNGKTEKIDMSHPPTFLDLHEKDLLFSTPVQIRGKAYLTNDDIVLSLNIDIIAHLPCSICNQPSAFPISLKNYYITQNLKEITDACFDYQEALREAILLEVPPYLECNAGHCPNRGVVDSFLAEETEKNFPFKELEEEN